MTCFLVGLFIISFLLNFVWEVSQMPFFAWSGFGDYSASLTFLGILWRVSILDAVTVVIACLVISGIRRSWSWTQTRDRGWVLLLVGLLAWQGGVEYVSVYLYHRWAYGPSMPVLFGIGLLPLLQMVVVPPTAILLTRHLQASGRPS